MGCTYDADNMSNLFKEHKQSAKFTKNIVAKIRLNQKH